MSPLPLHDPQKRKRKSITPLNPPNPNPNNSPAKQEQAPQRKKRKRGPELGNLPPTTTTSSLHTHFAKIHPIAIRHRTEKRQPPQQPEEQERGEEGEREGEGKSKGFAFLEFEAYDRMKTCLKTYHHSVFDDGVSAARRIRVELTVGGGGAKSKERKTKLKAKNWKLSEERRRRAVEGAKVERKKARTKKQGQESSKTEVGEEKVEAKAGAENGDIHPSRRSRVTTR